MAFRFNKRIKIAPGITLNLSKSGASTSVGPRGAKLTVGKNVRTTIGAPGTGLSHTTVHAQQPKSRTGLYVAAFFLLLIVLVASANAHPGRTDKEGCHTDKKSGQRHCH